LITRWNVPKGASGQLESQLLNIGPGLIHM